MAGEIINPTENSSESEALRPPRRVLVVDDNHFVRDMFVSAFSRKGYAVMGADSRDSGIAVINDGFYPEFVLTDLTMPPHGDSAGLGVVHAAYQRGIPAVLVSGAPDPLIARDHFLLVKPVSLDNLFAVVDDALANPAKYIRR